MRRRLRLLSVPLLGTLVIAAALAGGCRRAAPSAPGQPPSAPADAGAPANGRPAAGSTTLLLSPEDLHRVQAGRLTAGPIVSGAIQPERRADLRAEIAAIVTQVLKDNGQPVKAGDLLVRLDDTSLRDALASAQEAQRTSGLAEDQAARQVQRLKTLQQQGMISTQALEDAQVRHNAAQSDLVAARARVTAARQQMQRTSVRAPFDGVVSERKASVGDTAQIGKELLKVIDPRSMRFEALVAADRLGDLKVGQPAHFRVNGFGSGEFAGTVQRLDAAVNTTTRQVAVVIGFDDPAAAPRVAGLFAEGRIDTGGAPVLTLPENAIVRSGDTAHVWRIDGQRVVKTAVRLGDRDPRSGEVPVIDGLKAGDRVLRNPGSALVDGQPVEMAPAVAAAASAAR
ncbi:MAG: efflux RND transporter periplasmic adaptor subunit [Rubrivivax sp.]